MYNTDGEGFAALLFPELGEAQLVEGEGSNWPPPLSMAVTRAPSISCQPDYEDLPKEDELGHRQVASPRARGSETSIEALL